MSLLLLGLILLLGVHSLAMRPSLHGKLVTGLGPNIYRGVYSVISLVGLVMLIEGFGSYRAEGMIEVWSPPTALKHLNSLFMLVSFIALAAAYTPRGHIKMRLKHPMLVAVKA